jgi:hypothetical protein
MLFWLSSFLELTSFFVSGNRKLRRTERKTGALQLVPVIKKDIPSSAAEPEPPGAK